MSTFRNTMTSLALLFVALPQAAAQADKSDDDWHFSLAPLFLWGMGIDGRTAIGPAEAPLDIEFKDALENMDAVLTFQAQAHAAAKTTDVKVELMALMMEMVAC